MRHITVGRFLLAVVALLALLSPTVTFSAAPSFEYKLPSTRADGSALPAADISLSTVKCGTAKNGPYPTTKAQAGGTPGATVNVPADFATVTDGWHYCVVTVTGKGNSAGESGPSGEVAFFTLAGVVIANPLAPAAASGLVFKPQ